jgi:serine-type D-Ala-D-Ala endopeptidase (penicillin-binding protein 7)
MFKIATSLCALLAALALAMPAQATAASAKSKTASSQKSGKAAKSSAKKAPAKTAKTAKKSTNRQQIKKNAIANARKSVHVTRATARPITLENPGLSSSAALIMDERTGEVLYQKNPDELAPIASITKLMTAMVVLDAQLPLNELLTISQEDVDTLKNTSSRLAIGTTLTRGELLLLSLMSSENRAASALSRHYPGGRDQFIRKMNEKAASIGMPRSRFFDATGLTPHNVSTPRELAILVKTAHEYPEIHQFSTSSEYNFISNLNGRTQSFHNTNPLVNSQAWEIGLSKTGYINEAGRCLVMQATINDAPVVMVLLDSNGKYTRLGDAQRIRKWLETTSAHNSRAG